MDVPLDIELVTGTMTTIPNISDMQVDVPLDIELVTGTMTKMHNINDMQ